MTDAPKPTPQAGELTTTNYNWVKPTVGASVDAWGGYLNTDLDGIDSTVKGVSNVANAAAPLASPAFTGTPSLPTGTTGVTQAAGTSNTTLATTAFVGALPVAMGDNRIINGDMRIDQRNAGGAGSTANVYTVDRWQYSASQVSKGFWQQAASSVPGFPYRFGFTSSSVYASVAGDNFNFIQAIEADMVSDFAWGTANAQPATLSFWVYSSLSGTFGGAIRNAAGTRSYPFTYTLVASTWTKIIVTIPADTSGTWVMSGNGAALWVCFDLGCGTTYRGPAGAWASANYLGANGAVSVVATNGATFYVTGVKLEIGSVATPFNRQSLAKSMADCQWYYQKLGGSGGIDLIYQNNATGGSQSFAMTVGIAPMRAAPTATIVGIFTYSNLLSGVTLYSGLQVCGVAMASAAAGSVSWYSNSTTAFVTLSAEL